jgi:hypothetical protein
MHTLLNARYTHCTPTTHPPHTHYTLTTHSLYTRYTPTIPTLVHDISVGSLGMPPSPPTSVWIPSTILARLQWTVHEAMRISRACCPVKVFMVYGVWCIVYSVCHTRHISHAIYLTRHISHAISHTPYLTRHANNTPLLPYPRLQPTALSPGQICFLAQVRSCPRSPDALLYIYTHYAFTTHSLHPLCTHYTFTVHSGQKLSTTT